MDEELREAARNRIAAKRNFWRQVILVIILTIILNIVWFVSGDLANYWPMWPMIGFLIWLGFSAVGTYNTTRGGITDTDIDREMRKMGGEA